MKQFHSCFLAERVMTNLVTARSDPPNAALGRRRRRRRSRVCIGGVSIHSPAPLIHFF